MCIPNVYEPGITQISIGNATCNVHHASISIDQNQNQQNPFKSIIIIIFCQQIFITIRIGSLMMNTETLFKTRILAR